MLKKLAKRAVAVASLLLGMACADALAGPTTIEIKENGLGNGPITVISQNGASWTKVEPGELTLPIKVRLDVSNGQPIYYKVFLGEHEVHYAQMLNYSEFMPSPPSYIEDWPLMEFIAEAKGNASYITSQKQQILDRCNQLGNPDQDVVFDFELELRMFASFWLDGGIELLNQGPATGTVIVPVLCKKGIQTGLDIANDYGPYKPSKLELYLTTYSNDTFRPTPGGPSCPVLHVLTRVTANKAGLASVERIQQISGGPNTTANLFIGTNYQPDGTFVGESTQKFYLGPGTYAKFYARVQSGDSVISTPWKDITIFCKGAGNGGLASDTSTHDEPLAPPAKYDGELTIANAPNAKRDRCPRQGQVAFRINSNSGSAVSYRLDGSNGQSWTGTLQMFPSPFGPGKFKGVGVKTFDVSKTGNVTFALKRVKGDKAYVLDFRAKQFTCKTPAVNAGSSNLKPDSNQPSRSTSVPAILVDKRKSDAVKHRLEAAKKKKAAIAKRKAATALKLKVAKDAAIAKRKRDARKKSAALLKFQKLTANGMAIAKRKAAAAANRRAAPSSVGAATQMRVIRRR